MMMAAQTMMNFTIIGNINRQWKKKKKKEKKKKKKTGKLSKKN